MAIMLVCDDLGWAVDVPLQDHVFQALCYQYYRAEETNRMQSFSERLARHLPGAITEALDPDLKPPSDEQQRFASAIAAKLGVPVPIEAAASRLKMTEFIAQHVQEFRKVGPSASTRTHHSSHKDNQ